MNLKLLDSVYFHDSIILGYEKVDNDIILKFTEDIFDYNIYKLTFKNARVNEGIDSRIAFDLNDAVSYLDTGEICIFGGDYGKNDNNEYFFKLELVGVPNHLFDYSNLGEKEIDYQGEMFYGEKYFMDEYITTMIISDDIIFEELTMSKELIDKYDRNSDYYKNNYNSIVRYLKEDVIKFINDFYIFVYACYDKDKNLMLYFKDDISNAKKFVYLKLINSNIQLLDNDINDIFVISNKIQYINNSNNIRIYRNENGYYELGFLISEIREIVVKCKDIEYGLYDWYELIDIVKSDNYNRISYYGSCLYNYKNIDSDISFYLKEKLNNCSNFKFNLRNVKFKDVDNDILNKFNDLIKKENINIYSGEFGLLDKYINGYKYYLELCFVCNDEFNICEDKYNEMNIKINDDYDKNDLLCITFLAEDIDIEIDGLEK